MLGMFLCSTGSKPTLQDVLESSEALQGNASYAVAVARYEGNGDEEVRHACMLACLLACVHVCVSLLPPRSTCSLV